MGQQLRTLTDAERDEQRRRAGQMVERNEELARRAAAGEDSGTSAYDTIIVTGNGLRGASWAGDTFDTVYRAWKDANPESRMSRSQFRNWFIANNATAIINVRDCEGNLSTAPNLRLGSTIKLPEGNEIRQLNWKYSCPIPDAPTPETPAAPPPETPRPSVSNTVVAPEYYPFQATTQGGNNNGLINAYEMLAATGVEPFVQFYRRPDIQALDGSRATARSGQNRDYMNQGPRRDDTPLSRRDNGSPRVTEERHLTQGAFYAGNLLTDKVDGRRVPNADAQRRFLDGQGFTGNDNHQWVSARVGLIVPFGGTSEPRGDMNIGQTSTTVDGAVMPTYTLSSEDFVNKDIWFINNPARTSAPVGTYDRALAYGDYQITAREFREGSQSLMARLNGGDTTITREEVQRVLNAGNYAQMNVLVRDAGIHNDIQSVVGDMYGRFQNYQWPATDQSPPLVLRNGVSPDILNTPVAELGGYRLRVASRERFDEIGRRYGADFRFEGFQGIEGQEMVGAYRVIHQRPSAVGQYVAENRGTLIRGTEAETGQRTTAALGAVLGTADAPNAAGTSALWAQAAERPEIAASMVNTLSRAYNNPEVYGFRNREEVAALVVGLTGQSSEAQRARDGIRGNEGDRGRNSTDDAIGSSDGTGIGSAPLVGSYLQNVQAFFGNNEGRMIDPQAFARIAAPRVAGDPALQAATARLFTGAPVADQVALLQSIGSDPRVEANFGAGQSMRALASASGASIDRTSPLFQGVVASEVYSRPGYSDVSVSARGYVNDWLDTYRAWQANGRQGAAPTIAMSPQDVARLQASGELTPEMSALITSNNPGAAAATTRTIVTRSNADLSDVDSALTAGNTSAAFTALVSGPQARASGAPQLVVESMRFNPALAANLVTATMLRDPAAFDSTITTLRALDRQYDGGGVPVLGNLFGLLDADKFGQAADALKRSQERVGRLDAATLDAARNGDARALRRVDDAMSPWNDFSAKMMSNPTSNGAHLRYAAYEQLWDAIGRDPRAQSAMVETMTAVPQFQEAAIEILNSTRMQSVDMREQQFIGRRGGDRRHAIPEPVSGPAITAASGLFVSFEPGRNGQVNANVNPAALLAPSVAPVAASPATVADSASAAITSGDTITVVTPPSSADLAAAPAAASGTPASGTPAAAAPAAASGTPASGTPAATAPAAASGTPASGAPAAAAPAAASGTPASGTPAAAAPAAASGTPASGTPAAAAPAAASGAPASGTPVVASIDGVLAAGTTLAASGTASSPSTSAATGLPGAVGIAPEYLLPLIPGGGSKNHDLPQLPGIPCCGGKPRPIPGTPGVPGR